MHIKFSKKFTSLAVLILISFLLTGVLYAKTNQKGTIYLKDGSKYENVIFSVDKYYKILTFESEGKEFKVSFSDIDRIYDESDNDITEEITGKSSNPIDKNQGASDSKQNVSQTDKRQAQIWNSERSESYQKAHEKLWNTAFLITPMYTLPSGYYYSNTEGGVSFAGNVMFAINRKIALRFHYSQPKIKFKPPLDFISISTNRILVMLQYNSYTSNVEFDKSMVYFYSGAGITDDDLDSYFTMSIGGGLIKMMSDQVGLNFELGLDIPGVYDDEIEALLIDLRIGFAFVL